MTRVLPALLIMMVLAGCGGGTIHEVATNSGGTLDCRSDTIAYATFDYSEDAVGAPTPEEAVTDFSTDYLPAGDFQPDEVGSDYGTFVVTDQHGYRIARAQARRLTNGWVIDWTEHCG